MKKIVKITESQLIKLIENKINETKVIFDKKPGKIIDSATEKVDGEKIKMVQIKFDDGSKSWECADDVKMKYK